MSCFLLPHSLCGEIEKAVAKFYWGASPGERKTHWLSWKKITRSKKNDGLGFREMYFFNLAIVTRQYWRLAHNQDSLAAQIL
ncbi:hypothetical protein ACS0TY_000487 [Phlomoides rotata]